LVCCSGRWLRWVYYFVPAAGALSDGPHKNAMSATCADGFPPSGADHGGNPPAPGGFAPRSRLHLSRRFASLRSRSGLRYGWLEPEYRDMNQTGVPWKPADVFQSARAERSRLFDYIATTILCRHQPYKHSCGSCSKVISSLMTEGLHLRRSEHEYFRSASSPEKLPLPSNVSVWA
jgi:hypothetical protein